jgi:hypothetical protein
MRSPSGAEDLPPAQGVGPLRIQQQSVELNSGGVVLDPERQVGLRKSCGAASNAGRSTGEIGDGSMVRSDLAVPRVELRQPEPLSWRAYRGVFRAPVRFGQRADRLCFSREEWRAATDNPDAALACRLEEHAAMLARRIPVATFPFSREVQHAIATRRRTCTSGVPWRGWRHSAFPRADPRRGCARSACECAHTAAQACDRWHHISRALGRRPDPAGADGPPARLRFPPGGLRPLHQRGRGVLSEPGVSARSNDLRARACHSLSGRAVRPAAGARFRCARCPAHP